MGKRGKAMLLLDVVIMLAVAFVLLSLFVGTDAEERQEHEYQDVTMGELHKAIKENPLKASDTYKGTRIRVTGKLKDIDARGRTFTVGEYYSLLECERIDCKVVNDEVRKVLSEAKDGEQVTVCGKVSRVDGTFGYALEVEVMER